MAFKLRQDVYHAQTRRGLLNNSLTVKIGDLIKPLSSTNGVLTNASLSGTQMVIGVVVGFTKLNGQVITTGTDPANTPGQLATASDNTTVDKYHARYVPITGDMEFSADLSAAAGTTTNSDGELVFFNLTDCRTVDEASVVQFNTAANSVQPAYQLMSWGLDPVDSSSKTIICKFAIAALLI